LVVVWNLEPSSPVAVTEALGMADAEGSVTRPDIPVPCAKHTTALTESNAASLQIIGSPRNLLTFRCLKPEGAMQALSGMRGHTCHVALTARNSPVV
jgi:hypothetical protein